MFFLNSCSLKCNAYCYSDVKDELHNSYFLCKKCASLKTIVGYQQIKAKSNNSFSRRKKCYYYLNIHCSYSFMRLSSFQQILSLASFRTPYWKEPFWDNCLAGSISKYLIFHVYLESSLSLEIIKEICTGQAKHIKLGINRSKSFWIGKLQVILYLGPH